MASAAQYLSGHLRKRLGNYPGARFTVWGFPRGKAMTETNKNVDQDTACAARSPDELYDQARRWIAEARDRCKDKAAIDEWKREMQDWGYCMSEPARDHRLAGAARTAAARQNAFQAMLRTKR